MSMVTIFPTRDAQRGDIVFFAAINEFPYVLWDWAIHIVSPTYTHVGIYLGDGEIIHADLGGVRRTRLCNCRDTNVLRLREGTDIEAMIRYAEDQEFEPYSVPLAVSAGILRLLKLKRTAMITDDWWFCSKLVAGSLKYCAVLSELNGVVIYNVIPDDLPKFEIWR